MACYHPNFALKPGHYLRRLSNYDNRWEIVSKDTSRFDYCLKNYGRNDLIGMVPCGQCSGCRLEKSRQWAMRCMLESSLYQDNFFVTLTYDDEHVPIETWTEFDPDTGEAFSLRSSMSLNVIDLQLFKKSLLEYFRIKKDHVGIRFYGCGEYGDLKNRPHYHVIFFNLPLDDLKIDREYVSHSGHTQYISSTLDRLWGRGRVRVSEVNFQTAAYVSRYCMKKITGKGAKDYYEKNHLKPPFSIMSRNPGIGREFYEKHKDDIYRTDNLVFHQSDRSSVTSKPPVYFDRLFDIDDPDLLSNVKAKRESVSRQKYLTALLNTDLSYFEYLLTKEDVNLHKIKGLLRPLD